MSDTAAPKRHRGRRLTVVSSAVLAVVALVLTGFALRYPGLSSSDVDVSNGGVWVTNEQAGLLGRLNVDAGELDARLSSAGQDLDIIQSGYTVFETGPRGFTPINTASVTRNGLVELPTGTTVKIGGDRVVLAAPDGRVWIVSPEEAAAFSPSAVEPVLEAGNGQRTVAVSNEGDVFVLDRSQLLVYPRVDDTRDTVAEDPIEVPGVSQKAEALQLSAVGDEPVILDRENALLRVGRDMDSYSLADYGVSSLEDAQLQQSGPAADTFVVSTIDSLFVIPFDGGSAKQIAAGGTGTDVVRPAQVQGCAYGAWGGSKRYVRACEGEETIAETIPEADNAADLTLRVNQDLVVLNDQKFGLSWKIMDNMQVVDNWVISQDIQTSTAEEKEKETLTTTITNTAAERDEENRQPTANEDTFGVRPGKSIVLPVTRNDTDPDGDILTVAVQGDQPGIGSVSPIRGGTQLQIEVAEDASGTASFTYEADDGRGGTDTATVNLEVRADGENSPPELAEQTIPKVKVRSGEEVSFNILPYWEDPDGDAFYLANAVVEPEDLVTFRPDGQITFNDAGLSPGAKQITLTFRDENGATGEGIVEIESVTDSDLAPITTADHANIIADRGTTLKPLVNDLNPNGGDLQLLSVGETEGLEVEPSLEAGTVEVTGREPGTYYLEYTVSATGSSTASLGLIRVDVEEPTQDDLKPVAVDDMSTVTTGSDSLVDPLENDVDPTGGVLVVNSIDLPDTSGLKATVVNHHLVRIEAEPDAEVSQEPVSLTYEVANSSGSTTGTIRVMVASTDTQFANPEAVPDRAVVRAGDMVNIDVTANDVSPTSSDLHLGKIMDTSRADDHGHAETHQDKIRFRADDDASGEAVVQYEVVDETGRTGSALVHITIVPREAENTPPQPKNLTARTVAGTTVRIPVSTTGIDPDGDSVMLTGITSPMPTLGEIVSANGEWIEYRPYDDSRGTDRFRYQVMDRHGAIGTAEVLVGVAAPSETNQAPFAVDDTVEVRPDREVQIPVLDNDTDPEGDELGIVRGDVEPMTEIEEIPPADGEEDGYLTVVTPEESGTHTVLYSATDGQLKSSATATIKVASNAPLRSPVARDDFVDAADVMDPKTQYLDVDVLANDSDPDGSTKDLELEIDGTYEGAQLQGDEGTIRVVPQEEQQRIRYVITDVDGLESAGYIWVPGTAKQPPVWVGEDLKVQAGSEVEVDLADPNNVRVRAGAQPAQITDPDLVTAPHSDGSQMVKDESTLVYRPAEGFSGKDTISVEVTDGEVGDASAATATLAIPVEVAPEETNLPPTFQGALLEVEQGGPASTLDLSAGAEDPEQDELSYALGEFDEVAGVSVSLEGAVLTASATSKATKGTVVDVPVTVSDGTNPEVPATVQLTVAGSQRPEIATALDKAQIDAGRTQEIDVLANDSNPFPGGDRTVTSASLLNGQGEVTVTGNKVTITPDKDYAGILTAEYQVLDDTEDPDREVSGMIQVTVRGLPEAPSAPRIGEVGDGFVELTFNAGDDNGAPITGYTVTSASGPAVTQECASTSCTITGLTNDTEYTFQVVATNEVGPSDPSVPSAVARPDVRPEKPAAPHPERGDEQLTVAWQPPVNRGSAIQTYEVQMQNTATQEISTQELSGGTTQTVFTGLTNGVDYRFRVRASNLAEEPSDWSEWSRPEHPAGKPKAPSATPTAERIDDPRSGIDGGGIKVTWPTMTEAEANGEPITQYIVTASSGASQTVDASKTSATFLDLDRDSKHSFTYKGVNSVGESPNTSKASNAVTPWVKPSAPTGVNTTMPSEGKGDGPDGRATVHWNAADGNGTTITKYVVRWKGGSKTVDGSATSAKISGLKNGTSYRFTVEARNGFEADGGVSERAESKNTVTPYTSPARPSISSTSAKCTGGNSCPVSFTFTANGDGGGSGLTIHYRIGGGEWRTTKKGSITATEEIKAGSTVKAEAYVTIDEGLKSSSASKSQKAQSWQRTPKFDKITWGEMVPAGTQGCSGNNCQWFRITLRDMTPGETYKVTFSNEGEYHYKTIEMTANSNGTATSAPKSNFYGYVRGGVPSWPMTVEAKVNGKWVKVADGIYRPY